MKFKCTTDTTKKFTPGKVYETPASHAIHNVAIRDDNGRARVFSVTHEGEGIRWNSGGNKAAVMKKLKPSFRIDENGTMHISDGEVTRIKIGSWGGKVNERQISLFRKLVVSTICAVSVGALAGIIYTLF